MRVAIWKSIETDGPGGSEASARGRYFPTHARTDDIKSWRTGGAERSRSNPPLDLISADRYLNGSSQEDGALIGGAQQQEKGR